MTFDRFDNLYISDYGCSKVRKVNQSGIITTIAGNGSGGFSGDGGPATAAQLAYPCKVAVDNAGNIYIPDAQNHRIRKVNTSGIISTVAGTGAGGYSGDGGPATTAQLMLPGSVVADNAGNLYVGDDNHVIRKIATSAIITTFAGNGVWGYTGDGGAATLASMALTEGRISKDYNDNIYFVNYQVGNVIRKITNCVTASLSNQPTNVTLCNSGNAVFSVTATNANSYQWQEKIGVVWNNLSNNATYSGTTTNTLAITGANIAMNNYQYRCVVTNSCGSIYSLIATLIVNTPSAPTINIATAAISICSGTSTVFTSTVFNGGNAPVYQWNKNGLPVGTNSNIYNDNSLLNADIITCTLTSNSTCATSINANSNSIVMTVNPMLTATIVISASQNNFCFGTTITFNIVSTNGGSSPSYQWKKNGLNVGTNSSIYTNNALQNADVITCNFTSSENCLTANNVVSNAIVMNVTPLVTPVVVISAVKTSLCKGETASFNALPANGGTTPIFQWKKNGLPVGSNSNSYVYNNILNNDVVTCTLTSNGNCLTSSTASSNIITMRLNPDPIVLLNKTNSICIGNSKVLDAGFFSSYLWNNGNTNRTLTITLPGTYFVKVTDNNGCTGTDTSILTTLLPLPQKFLPADSSICTYDKLLIKANIVYSNYLWNTGAFGASIIVTSPGLYWLEATDNNGCTGKDSIKILQKDCLKGLYIANSFTPNGDTKNDVFKPIIYGTIRQFEFRVLNRYGEIIFYTKDVNKGWDGKFKGTIQNTGAFTWICTYQIDQQMVNTEKGSVLLLR